MKYSEIIKKNAELKTILGSKDLRAINVVSNVTVNYLKEILEFSLRSEDVNAEVRIGGFDTIVQDSLSLQGDKSPVIIFWELINVFPDLRYRINLTSDQEFADICESIERDILVVLRNFESASLILFNTFSGAFFITTSDRRSRLQQLEVRLNNFLLSLSCSNLILVDVSFIYQQLSLREAIDLRMFRIAKTLHTVKFFIEYAKQTLPVFLSIYGKAKKALILDCDNTLWGGILGEDGFEGIKLGTDSKDGALFYEVQSVIRELANSGVIIGLNSKNNSADVDEILNTHPHMLLRDGDIAIKYVNWEDKVSNLLNIAKDLNIGIDSIVFVDDSQFELGYVAEKLPQVKTILVPPSLYEYPSVMREVKRFFFNHSISQEDVERVKSYKADQFRKRERESYKDLNSYLESLQIKLTIYENDQRFIPRIAQLTQKTNQFNLTTKRYTENDIGNFLSSGRYRIFAFDVSDRFGGYGVTGLAIVELNDTHAFIDSFLMSCRVLGRNVEKSFLIFIVESLKTCGIKTIETAYIKTKKNGLVEDFFDNMSFKVKDKNDERKTYIADTISLPLPSVDYIEVLLEK